MTRLETLFVVLGALAIAAVTMALLLGPEFIRLLEHWRP